MRLKTVTIAFLFITGIITSIDMYCQGLRFSGMDYPIDKRSSYSVFDKSVLFRDSLSISFLFCSMPPSEFGYIMRIKDEKDKKASWNMSYDGTGDTVVIRLNEEGHNSLIKAELSHSDIQPLRWIRISVKFDFVSHSVAMSIGDRNYTSSSENMKQNLHAGIYFGKSDYFIDVPTFAIKDLHISGAAFRNSIHFSFNESSGNTVHDDKGLLTGTVNNPGWLLEESLKWKTIGDITITGNSGTAWNPVRQEIYALNNEEIIILNIINNEVRRRTYDKQCPVRLNLGSNYVSQDGNNLYVYEVFNLWNEPQTFMTAKLDLNTFQWTPLGKEELPMPLFHHCSFINPINNQLMLFGGFGNALYNGSYYTLDEDGNWDNIWENYNGDKVYPRYFASAGVDYKNGDIYIYGGMGNESGEQIVGRQYYYDLHRINPETGESKLLWNLDIEDDNFVPVSELIVIDDCFYTLCYPEYQSKSSMSLFMFDIKSGQRKKFEDSIEIDSDRIHTHADIYYDESIQKFFALKYEAVPGNEGNRLTVYSISYPPMNQSDLPKDKTYRKLLLAVIFCFIFIIGISLFIAHKRKKSLDNYSDGISMNLNKRYFSNPERANAVYLFGDFCAKDRYGKDVSYMFSPKLRQMFCLILQFSSEGGISSKRMSMILWPDKDDDKVKNSRGVSINHLRKILEQFDDIKLVYENGRYRFDSGDRFYCDCIDYLTAKSDILVISSRGRFLKFQNEPIFDEFKAMVEGKVVPELHNRIESLFQNKEYPEVIEVASMLFDIDPLDEKALSYQVKAFKKLKMQQSAAVRISEFAAEYKNVNGTNFKTEPYK